MNIADKEVTQRLEELKRRLSMSNDNDKRADASAALESRKTVSSLARRMAAAHVERAAKLNKIAEWVEHQPQFVQEMVWEMLMRDHITSDVNVHHA